MAEMEARLCSLYGAAAAKATLARNILAPVAGRLSGHPSELHRRCILLRRLSSSRNTGTTGDLCERFSAYAPVEAIAVSGALRTAVVVFETVAGWRAAAAATLSASCDTVPPLYFGPPLVLVDGRDIKVALHPKKPAAASPGGGKDVVSSFGDEMRCGRQC
ncbi:uncharacterized protein [Oryza sativa Japonica Group]|uniref:Uncharacterized protein n=1 Tax=Oryza sativa subsp. japonica TaxID=39947 RepID=Q7F0K7_ORYSJ|nr:hypothetical protein OsJ_25216 [Oryza sativa Japonica Group]BAC20668.1 hypothetical protein [Oryza sativa Japonica Group]BAC22349.1 hypothetical protein [Oryza sativa Japonica Group]